MRRIGIISDLHSDLGSLDAALARLRALGCEIVLCVGDLVDGDSFPDEVIARLAADNIPTIRGNHDRWALEHAGSIRRGDADGQSFGSGFEVSKASLRFLAGLPTSLTLEVEGVRVVLHHASPGSDMLGIDPARTPPSTLARYLADTRADVLVVGHTHQHFALPIGAGLVVNPGALYAGTMSFKQSGALYVPDPKAPPTGGTFGILELPAKRFTVHRAVDGAVVMGAR